MGDFRDVAVIRSARLDLVLFSTDVMSAILHGARAEARRLFAASIPDELFPVTIADVDFFRMRRDQVVLDACWGPWSLRGIVLREDNAVVGTANFHGPPGVNDTHTPHAAEVGYEIFERYRCRGFATEVAVAMLGWAHRMYGVTHFISGVAPDNAPSLRVNEKLGFARTGAIVDGEIIFEMHLRG
jgi:RimJ/RimL family protein N-acetyltransferase